MKQKSVKLNAIFSGIRIASSMIFPLITFQYASKVLQVENIGKVNFGESIINYFVLLAGLGISTYAIREGSGLRDNKNDFNEFISEIFSINLISMIISYSILFIFMLKSKKLYEYRILLLIQSNVILFTTIGIEWIYSIYEDFFFITIRSILFQILSFISMIIMVNDSSDYPIYAAIIVMSSVGSNVINFIYSKKFCNISLKLNKNMFKHIKPILIIFFMNLATIIYVNSDITMLGYYSNDYNVGIYAVAVKIYSILKSLLSVIIMVTLPRLSYYRTQKMELEYLNMLEKIFSFIMIIILPVVVGINLLGKEIIVIISGESYLEAIIPLKILSFTLVFSIFAWFFSTSILLTLKKEKYTLISTLFAAIVNILLNFILIPKFNQNGAAVATLISEAVVFLINFYYVRRVIKINIYRNNIITSLIGCVAIVIVDKYIRMLIKDSLIYLVLVVMCSVIIYIFIMLIFKNQLVIEVKNSFVKKLMNREKIKNE